MDPSRFDLNLLKVFSFMLQEHSVARTAERMHVSASAISHALKRLRSALDDPLFVRVGQDMVPTQRALALGAAISPFLSSLDATLAGRNDASSQCFDPASTSRVLNIVAPGALELTLIPMLARRLRLDAPGWSLSVSPFQRRSYEADLVGGQADFIFSVGGHTPGTGEIVIEEVWQDEVVVLAGPDSVIAGLSSISMDRYLSLPQIYPLSWSTSHNYLDVFLARQGRHRHLAVSVPGYAGIGEIVVGSDMVASMPDRTARAILNRYPELRIIRIEPAMQSGLSIEWCGLNRVERSLIWARDLIREIAFSLPRGVGEAGKGETA